MKKSIQEDLRRVMEINDLRRILEDYKKGKKVYPDLRAGSYQTGWSFSVWPSWQETLGRELGKDIPIEERSVEEVKGFRDYHWAAAGVKIRNPAFDVTPAELVTGLITERGVVLQPDAERLRKLMSSVV